MPRRNRNVRAYRIDADELADQAAALAADLDSIYGCPASLTDTQVVIRLDLL